MALVLNTNSYVAVADAETYFETRIDAATWNAASNALKEEALVTATQLIDNRSWIGSAVSSSQALAWPRKNTSHYNPRLNLEVKFTESEIPTKSISKVVELYCAPSKKLKH
jgi:hypothetical protein